MSSSDALGDELERIGRCDDLQDPWTSGVCRSAIRRSTAHHKQRKRDGSQAVKEAPPRLHENDYHLELVDGQLCDQLCWSGHPPASVTLRSRRAGILASSLSKTINRSNCRAWLLARSAITIRSDSGMVNALSRAAAMAAGLLGGTMRA